MRKHIVEFLGSFRSCALTFYAANLITLTTYYWPKVNKTIKLGLQNIWTIMTTGHNKYTKITNLMIRNISYEVAQEVSVKCQ